MSDNTNYNCYDYIFKQNTERMRPVKSIDLAELVAKKAARTLWGKGYHINTDSDKIKAIFKDLDKNNNFYELFYQSEKILSAFGFLVPYFDITKSGIIKVGLALPWMVNQVAFHYDNEELARVFKMIKIDNSSGYQITNYSREEITNDFELNNQIVLGNDRQKIAEALQVPLVQKTPKGIIPVSFFSNLPKLAIYGGSMISKFYPDDVGVAYVQEMLDQAYEIASKEQQYNRTRIFANLTPQEVNDYVNSLTNGVNDYSVKQKIMGNAGILLSDFIMKVNVAPIEGQGKAIEILQGDPKMQSYSAWIDYLIDFYISGCGYSPKQEATVQKTEAETLFTKTSEVETVNLKKTLRQKQWKRFFDKILLVKGCTEADLDNYSFEIKDSMIMDDMKMLDKEQAKIQMGISSRLRALMTVEQITEQEAKQKLEKIDKERLQDNKMVLDMSILNDNSMAQNTPNNEIKDHNTELDTSQGKNYA